MDRSAHALARRPAVDDDDPTVKTHLNVRSVALTVLAAAAVMWLLNWAQQAFIPVVLSVLISYALEPLVVSLMRLRLPRVAAAIVVMASVVGLLGYGAYTLTDDAAAVLAQVPEAAQKLRQTVRRDGGRPGAIEQVQRAAEELQRTADEAAGTNPVPRDVTRVQVEEPALDVREYITWGSASLIAFAGQAALVFFFVFFLLASGDLFKRKLVKLAGPSLQKKRITVEILDDINTQIARFLVVRLFSSVIVGVATFVAFRLIGLDQAAVWAIAAGILNTIPYFGPLLVASGTAIVAFVQFGTIGMAAYVSGISLAITTLEGWILTPWLTSRASHTNEVAIFLALIFWTFVWGLWGTLLAVPMLVVVKAYCDRIEDLKPIGELLAK